MTKNKQAERQQFWLEHVHACAASGQTSKAYAAQHGLNVQSLYAARKRLNVEGGGGRGIAKPQRFVRVETTPSVGTLCRVQLPNGATVELHTELSALSEVLRCVGALT